MKCFHVKKKKAKNIKICNCNGNYKRSTELENVSNCYGKCESVTQFTTSLLYPIKILFPLKFLNLEITYLVNVLTS